MDWSKDARDGIDRVLKGEEIASPRQVDAMTREELAEFIRVDSRKGLQQSDLSWRAAVRLSEILECVPAEAALRALHEQE